MRTTVQIGKYEVDMLCNALTPILYRNAYQGDILLELTGVAKNAPISRKSREELQAMSLEERKAYLEELNSEAETLMGSLNSMQDTVSKLGYVMYMQAKMADADRSIRAAAITEEGFFEWLSQFEVDDLTNAMAEILAAYQIGSKTKSQPKNQDDRSTENTAQQSTH